MDFVEHKAEVYAYLVRCINKGWGFNSAGRDVWGDQRVLDDTQVASLESMETARHPGWEPSPHVEIDPFAVLASGVVTHFWDESIPG